MLKNTTTNSISRSSRSSSYRGRNVEDESHSIGILPKTNGDCDTSKVSTHFDDHSSLLDEAQMRLVFAGRDFPEFQLVKISCRKENTDSSGLLMNPKSFPNVRPRKQSCWPTPLIEMLVFTKAILFLACTGFLIYTVYRLVDALVEVEGRPRLSYSWSSAVFGSHNRPESLLMDGPLALATKLSIQRARRRRRGAKRSVNVYSADRVIEWSGEKLASMYESDLLTFFDSNANGFGKNFSLLAN